VCRYNWHSAGSIAVSECVKHITNWAVFGEIQTATTTIIASLTRFRLISHPFENLFRIPTGPWGSSQSPYPSCTRTHENSDTHARQSWTFLLKRQESAGTMQHVLRLVNLPVKNQYNGTAAHNLDEKHSSPDLGRG